MKGHLLRISVLLGCILILFSSTLLTPDLMFSFHDVTQAARVSEFSTALQQGQFPPRISHTFSFEMGYPVFNFYAPTAYWITSGLDLLGLSIPDAIKISFLLSVCVLAVGSYLLFMSYFSPTAALFGALLLSSSTYIALEIFVRGNIAEMWFLALFPLTLYAIRYYSRHSSKQAFVCLTVLFSALITAHNVLSIIGVVCMILFSIQMPQRKSIFLSLLFGLILSAYFLIPAFGELHWTHARMIASNTMYADNFVCPRQLWSSPWAFGGSVVGCDDGMSFMLGKILILTGAIGFFAYLFSLRKRKNGSKVKNASPLVYILMVCGGIFLSMQYSHFVWKMAEPFLKLFQFPWRFLGFAVIGLSFFSAYFMDLIKPKVVQIGIMVILGISAVLLSHPYFISNPNKTTSEREFEEKFISQEYMRNIVVYRIPEYIPSSVDYLWWVDLQAMNPPIFESVITPLDNGYIEKEISTAGSYELETTSKSFFVNKHYLPYWHISIDNTEVIPTVFDQYGRPRVSIDSKAAVSNVRIYYSQTPLEKFSNILSLTGLVMLACVIQPKIWKKLIH